MRLERALLVFSVFWRMGNSFPQYNCSGICAGLESSAENDTTEMDSSSSTESLIDVFGFVNELNSSLRFATPCETPNHEVSYCMEITKCPLLDNVKSKRKYSDYVQASKCGPDNEDPENFKVCCGKYNNFLNSSNKLALEESRLKLLPENVSILPQKCGTQKHIFRPRIVGGIEAVLGEYPWMARLIHKNPFGQKSYGCAGFLIHTKYVVTAAHCIHSEFTKVRGDPFSILLGEHNVTTKIDCSLGGTYCADPVQISRISKIIVHEDYSHKSKNHHNDVALIHLRKAVKLTDYVQPICLLAEEPAEVKKYFISGWGKTETSESSPVKLKVDLLPFDREVCKEKFSMLNLEIDDSQICAGGEKMKDSCNGDSGGPLMITNDTHYFAAGLVSYGIGCGMEHWPGVYTNMPNYVNWIKLQMLDVSTKSPKIKKHRKKNKKKAQLTATINPET